MVRRNGRQAKITKANTENTETPPSADSEVSATNPTGFAKAEGLVLIIPAEYRPDNVAVANPVPVTAVILKLKCKVSLRSDQYHKRPGGFTST